MRTLPLIEGPIFSLFLIYYLISISSLVTPRPAEPASSASTAAPASASSEGAPLPLVIVSVLLQSVHAALLQGRLAGSDHSPIVNHCQRLVVVVIDCLLSILKITWSRGITAKILRLQNTYLRKISLSFIMLPLLGFEVTLSLEEI